jgi:hypothetical protein
LGEIWRIIVGMYEGEEKKRRALEIYTKIYTSCIRGGRRGVSGGA